MINEQSENREFLKMKLEVLNISKLFQKNQTIMLTSLKTEILIVLFCIQSYFNIVI